MSLPDEELALLLDVLLPGDDAFPSASATGMLPKVRERLGGDAMGELAEAIAACGGPLGPHVTPARVAVVERLERRHAALFERLLHVAYLTYYGSEAAVSAITATGMDYHLTPQPEGYVLEPFDPAIDAPRHGRGRWLRTEEVRRVRLPEGLA